MEKAYSTRCQVTRGCCGWSLPPTAGRTSPLTKDSRGSGERQMSMNRFQKDVGKNFPLKNDESFGSTSGSNSTSIQGGMPASVTGNAPIVRGKFDKLGYGARASFNKSSEESGSRVIAAVRAGGASCHRIAGPRFGNIEGFGVMETDRCGKTCRSVNRDCCGSAAMRLSLI